jgi:hypothetical protein
MKKLIAFLAVLVVGITFTMAEDAPKKEGHKHDPAAAFKKLDTDGDGVVTLEEFKAGYKGKDPSKAEGQFKKMNKSGDGKLTLEEFTAAHKPKEAAPAPAAEAPAAPAPAPAPAK